MLPTLKRISLVFIIILSLAFFGYLVYTGMGAKTKASISTDVAGNGEIPYSTEGLVAQWTFNEPNSDIARSEGSCGKQCDGQLVNFAYTGSQDSAIGTGWTAKNKLWSTGSLMFDGVNDEVKVNNFQLLNANFTYEAWIKVTGGTGIESFGTLGPDPTHTWNFAYDNTKKRWDLWDKTNRSWYTDHDIGSTWHHVAVVYNGSTQYLYVDGTLKNSRSIISPIADGGGRTLQIGNTTNPQPLNGMLDAVRIYSRALSDQEVAANFQAQSEVRPTPPPVSSSLKPVGYWKFDEGTGNTVADSSGNGNNGTWAGTGNHWVDGKVGKAGNFNGRDDLVKVSNVNAVPASGFTWEAWVKPNVLGGTIISSVDEAGCEDFYLNSSGSGIYFNIDGVGCKEQGAGKATTSGAELVVGQWYHIAGTRSYTENTTKIYVNGVLRATATATMGSVNRTMHTNIGGIAGLVDGLTVSSPFNGTIDAVRIYSRALSDQEIAANFQAQNGPTPISQSLTATPAISGTPNASGILFKVRMPDVSQAVGTVKDVKVLITDKPGTLYDFTIDLQRVQGTDFFIANPIELDIPDGSYIFNVKQAKSLSRSFRVHLSKGKTLDCTQKDLDKYCESLGRPDLAPLYSGDSDGLVDTKINNGVRANSYNVIDSNDLQKVVSGYGVSPLPPEPNGDFNLDGKIDVQDLGILGKNFGKRGD